MAATGAVTLASIAAQMQSDDIRSLVNLTVSRRLRTGDLVVIREVLLELQDTHQPLKSALLYLESASWDVQDALFNIELDKADRGNSWIVEGHAGGPGALQAQNVELKRELAKRGGAFDQALYSIVYKTSTGGSRTIPLSESSRQNFDQDNRGAVDDLNRWRRSNIWRMVGPDIGSAASAGERWHPLQETWVRNRFGQSPGSKPDFKGMFADYVSVFEGVYLPGRAAPCTSRSHSAISSFLHRECINNINGVPAPKALTKDLLHVMAKDAVRNKWTEKLDNAAGGAGELLYSS